MKSKILGLLAVGLLTGSLAAQAVTVVVDGTTWEITYSTATFESFGNQPADMPWWGDSVKAKAFAAAVGDDLGLPWQGQLGPSFAYGRDFIGVNGWVYESAFGSPSSLSLPPDFQFPYAHVVREAIPEPDTLTLLGLCLAGVGLSRRRKVTQAPHSN